MRKGLSRFSVEHFFVLGCQISPWGNTSVLCFRKFAAAKKIMDKRGVSRFSVEKILSDSAEKFCTGTLLCCVSE